MNLKSVYMPVDMIVVLKLLFMLQFVPSRQGWEMYPASFTPLLLSLPLCFSVRVTVLCSEQYPE